MTTPHHWGMEDRAIILRWAGTVHAFAGDAYGRISARLHVGTGMVRLCLSFPELGYGDEVHDFGTGEEVDAYLATRFPNGYKAGLYEFGQKMTAIHGLR